MGWTTLAERTKAVEARKDDRADLARITAERAAMVFVPATADAVRISREMVSAAERTRKAECGDIKSLIPIGTGAQRRASRPLELNGFLYEIKQLCGKLGIRGFQMDDETKKPVTLADREISSKRVLNRRSLLASLGIGVGVATVAVLGSTTPA